MDNRGNVRSQKPLRPKKTQQPIIGAGLGAQPPLAPDDSQLDQIPQREHQQDQRSMVAQQSSSHLQRQESLRQQIALKEQQLAEMRSNTEQLRQQLATFGSRQATIQQAASPSRNIDDGRPLHKTESLPAAFVMKHDSIADLKAPFDHFTSSQNEGWRQGGAGIQGSPSRGITVYQNLRSRSGSRSKGKTPPRFGGELPRQGSEFQPDDARRSRPLLPPQIHPDVPDQQQLSKKASKQTLGEITQHPQIIMQNQQNQPTSLKKPINPITENDQGAPAENLNFDSRALDHLPTRGPRRNFSSQRPNRFDLIAKGYSNSRSNSPLRSGQVNSGVLSRETLIQPYFGSNPDLNMFLVPNISPNMSLENVNRPPVISPREVLQILIFENESSLRKIDLVKTELSQLRSSNALNRTKLDNTTQSNDALQQILLGIQTTDTDQSIAYLTKYVDHQRNTNQRLQRLIEDRDWGKKDAQTKSNQMRLDNEKEKGANSLLNTEIELVEVQINKLEGQTQELQSTISESLIKVKDDEAEAQELEKQVKELDEQIAEMLKEKEQIVQELEEKANDHEKSMDKMTEEKKNLEVENSQLLKIISAKVMFNNIESIRMEFLGSTFKEIYQYGAFDEKCHSKLRYLASLLYRQGMGAKKQAVSRWSMAVLKPLVIKEQNAQISNKIRKIRQISQPYHYLSLYAQENRIQQHSKQSSLRIVKFLGKRSGKFDLKRSMQIWKELVRLDRKQKQRLQRLVQKRHKVVIQQSFHNWRTWSDALMAACRLQLLKREYAHKLHYQLITSNMRMYSANEKQVKYIKKARTFLAIQNHKEYKRFYLKANLNTLRLRRIFRKYIVQTCFHALRNYSQRRRLHIAEVELDKLDYSINGNHSQIVSHGGYVFDKEKRIAMDVMRTMLSKNIYGYFQQWKQSTDVFNVKINTKLRDLIIRLYQEKMRRAFYLWRRGLKFRGIQWAEHRMIQSEQVVEDYKVEAVREARRTDSSAKIYQSQQRKVMSKVLSTMLSRKAKEGLYQWRRAMARQHTKESGAKLIIFKMRQRHVGHYFKIYKQCLIDAHADQFVIQREQDFIHMQNQKKLRKICEHWCAFVYQFKNQKVRLRILMKKIINYKKHRGLKRWVAGCQFKSEQLLKIGQNSLTQDLETKHQVMVAFQNITDSQHLQAKKVQEERRNLGRKTLMNYYTRFYSDATKRYFRIWQLVFKRFKTRQKMVIQLMHHRKRQMFNLTKSALQDHAAKERKQQKKETKKRMQIQFEEQQGQIEFEKEQAKKKIESLESQLETKTSKGQIYKTKQRIDKTMNIMINKNQKLVFKSGKRAVFLAWRDVATRQRRFLRNISRVCEKSFMAEGFARIHDAYVKNRGQMLVYDMFHKWFQSFNKDHLRVAWSRWKTMAHKQAYDQEKLAFQRHQEVQAEFHGKRLKIQDQNVQNILAYFKKIKKIKVLREWKKIRKYNKMRKILTEESAEKFATHKRKKFLQKWILRVHATHKLRAKQHQLAINYRIRMKIKILEVLQFKKSVNNTMALSMHNFEKMMRQKMMADAFKDITSFYLSKKHATDVFKKRSTLDAASQLTQRHLKVHRRVFNRFRCKVADERQRKQRLRGIFGNINAQRRHRGYRKWRELMEREIHVQEVNETGPITEHVFEANRLMRNLKEFMRSEGIPEEVIRTMAKKACDLQMDRMRYAVTRFRLYNDPTAKMKMKIFDHWKLMIKFRMAMKHWLVFGNNRVQWVKADIQEAFNKWRMGDQKRAQAFDAKPLKYLQAHNLKQTNELLLLANREAKCDVDLKDFSLQRDELLEHYIRGQRLALSACHERLLSGKKRAFSIWAGLLKQVRRAEGIQKVMSMVEKLAAVKDKKREIEKENQELAQENEELRIFSMNGYKIAESVNQLSAEREKLTIDLADQAETIKNLLEQNRRLQKQIELVRSNKENKQMSSDQVMGSKRPQKRVTFDQVR